MIGGLLMLGCQRGAEQAVTISPSLWPTDLEAIPSDPFGSPSPAYARLREVTDAALEGAWNGQLEDFADWLERETVAVERALGLLKALRVGAQDEYAVASARVALVYENIARTLTEASVAAEAAGEQADWKGQQGRIQEQANAFWMRCVRLCNVAGAHLDAWALRCGRGLARGQEQSSRQPE